MIRLKDILSEGPSDSDEKPNRIAKHLFGGTYTLVKKRDDTLNPGAVIFAYSDGNNTQYIAKIPKPRGEFSWVVRSNNEWKKIPPQSIPKIQFSPEELAARAERKRKREEDAQRRHEMELEKRRNFDAKFPNLKIDLTTWTDNPDLNFYIQNSELTMREQKMMLLHSKGYSPSDMSEIFGIAKSGVYIFIKNAMRKMKTAEKLRMLK